MWEQSFMVAQPNPIMQPETLRVMQPMYNEDVAISNLMIILVRDKDHVDVFHLIYTSSKGAPCKLDYSERRKRKDSMFAPIEWGSMAGHVIDLGRILKVEKDRVRKFDQSFLINTHPQIL